MAKKNTSFNNASFALATVWGSGINAQHQGGNIRQNAKKAGIKVPPPLTPAEIEAQELVAELVAEETTEATAELAADEAALQTLYKKYNVQDRCANLGPQAFYGQIRKMIEELKKAGIRTIKIDNKAGLQAELRIVSIKDISDEEWETTPKITTSNLRQRGIIGALRGAQKAIVLARNESSVYGILCATSVSPDLETHARDTTSGQKHRSYDSLSTGNFPNIFFDATSLQKCANHFNCASGIDITAIRANRIGFSDIITFGRVLSHDAPIRTELDLETMGFMRAKNLIEKVTRQYDPELWTSEIFKGKQGIVVFNKQVACPIALLLPPIPKFR